MSEVKVWTGQGAGSQHDSRSKKLAHLQGPPIFRVVIVQLLVSLGLFPVLQFVGMTVAKSALLGGLCCAIPNAYFVRQAFRYRGARAAKQIAQSFYKGEAGKLLLTLIAFTLAFTLADPLDPLDPLALFGGYILVQAVNWFTPLLIRRK